MGIMISPEVLRRIPLFSGLDDGMIKAFAMIGEKVNVPQGKWLFHEGEAAEAFYIILDGEVELRVSLSPESARRVCVTRLRDGELLGWSALLDPYRYHLSAIATADSDLAKFSGVAVCELMAHNPAIGYKIMSRVTKVIGQRLQSLRIQFVSMVEGGRWQAFSRLYETILYGGGRSKPIN